MNIFGIEIRRASKPKPIVADAKQLTDVNVGGGGWRSMVSEPFTGSWQRNISETQESVLCYPTLYACVSRIAKDIGKLTFQLKRLGPNDIWTVSENPAYSPVLRKPNHYQTQQQFREAWILSKLMHGNTYVLKQRDDRNVVVALYVLDPCRVKPLVGPSGEIFYELWTDRTNLVNGERPNENVIVPAREIIHDREVAIHHPLIGVPPLCAAYWPAVKNLRILRNADEFFANGAQPSGILTAPGALAPDKAVELQQAWTDGFTGSNAGRVAVMSDGLKFESLTAKSVDSQMVEQLRYSDEQICQPFGMPPFKIGIGGVPGGVKVDEINGLYYSDALQDRIEHMENLLDEGLGLNATTAIEMDLEPLLRMDQGKRADVEVSLVGGKIKTPNEARKSFWLPPIGGGDDIYGQQQDIPLAMLSERNDLKELIGASPDNSDAQEEDEIEDADESAEAVERMFA